jgi:hypothetical protein
LIGDYESLAILEHMEIAGGRAPAMNPKSLALLIKWKRGKAGTALLDSSKKQVIDVLGKPVVCKGGWNDPNNVQALLTVIRGIHYDKGNNGAFK